jgi:hypothetical protein
MLADVAADVLRRKCEPTPNLELKKKREVNHPFNGT